MTKDKNKVRDWIEIIGIFLVFISLILAILDYPDYPLKGFRIIPSNKECFVGGDYRNPHEICFLTYNVKIGPRFSGTIDLTPYDIEQPHRAEDKFYDILCRSFTLPKPLFLCDISSNISREYFIEIIYTTNKTPPLPEQKSLEKVGSIDCSFPDECRYNMKVTTDPIEYGLFGYRIIGPEKELAKGEKEILIEENGLQYDLVISDKDGNYHFDIHMKKGEWRIYTIHIPKS